MDSTNVSLRCVKGDYLNRTDAAQGVSTAKAGENGNEWTLEATEKENVYKLKSSKGDYLHRPDTEEGVTTWGVGIGNEWTLVYVDKNKGLDMYRLKSWKGDYLCRAAEEFGVGTVDVETKSSLWVMEPNTAG
jgi:hypothetical protein